jgi:hypothetical protein
MVMRDPSESNPQQTREKILSVDGNRKFITVLSKILQLFFSIPTYPVDFSKEY